MPGLLKFKEITRDLKEITTIKIYDKKKFHPEGLFSEQIFGPLKNYTCQCGKYYGISGSGGSCSICGVDITSCDERRRRYAKIVLPVPVVNPIFHDLVVELGGSTVKDAIKKLMKDEKSALICDNGDLVVVNIDEVNSNVEKWTRLEAVREMIYRLSFQFVSEEINSPWTVVYNNIDELILNSILVLPADLRPVSTNSFNEQYADKINKFYIQILTKKEICQQSQIDINRDTSLFYNHYRQFQKDVNDLYDFVLEKLSKKEGLIRGNILGKRIDFSGRAVISPDPTLNIDECYIPYVIFLEIFKIEISKKLIESGKFKLLNQAIDFIDYCIETDSYDLYTLCEEISKNEVCILNRQPSLHKLSMLAYYIKITKDSVIKIHPLSCSPFNADFDGDQMAIYIPITEECKKEVIEKILITKNLKNPSNGSLSTIPSQDMVLGIYVLTNNKIHKLKEEVEFKKTKMSLGMKIFNECFPDDYEVINKPVGSKELVRILNDINKKYICDIVAKVLDNIKLTGFKYSTIYGATLSLDDCFIEGIDKVRNDIYASGTFREQVFKTSSNNIELLTFLKKNFKYSYMIDSGARGSWDQAKQIVLSRGFVSNFNGQIIREPIVNSLVTGLTPKGFFNSTYGCRKGLLDVALNTGSSGYLSRKLIFTCANLQISYSCKDCGTSDTLEVYVRDEKKARQLINKWMVKDNELELITSNNLKSIIGNIINVRSPIFCKSSDICHTCYGELYKDIRTKFIGIIAAQSLGECNTQLVLRTFHTSGVANLRDSSGEEEDTGLDLKQQDIVSDLSSVSKLLHKFEVGIKTPELVDKLFTIYNMSRKINHVHFECVVSQLMWNGIKKWRLINDRLNYVPQFHSIQTVPSYESWLLGLAFSNPKKHIIKGILQPGLYSGIMDKILCGEKI